MVTNLFVDNAKVLASLQAARDVADKYKQNGLVNFIEERLDQHNKHAWMLRASMKS
jgi:DNA-binding ferritin-like protein